MSGVGYAIQPDKYTVVNNTPSCRCIVRDDYAFHWQTLMFPVNRTFSFRIHINTQFVRTLIVFKTLFVIVNAITYLNVERIFGSFYVRAIIHRLELTKMNSFEDNNNF